MEPQRAGTAQLAQGPLRPTGELPRGPDTGVPLEIAPPLPTEAPQAETARAGDMGAVVTADTREVVPAEAVATVAPETGEVVTGEGMRGEAGVVATGAVRGAAATVEGKAEVAAVATEGTVLTVEAVEEVMAAGITAAEEAAAMATVTAEALGKNTSSFLVVLLTFFITLKSLSHPGFKILDRTTHHGGKSPH